MRSTLSLFILSTGLAGCSFGDRSVTLTYDRPLGEPKVPRGVVVLLERPEDRRHGPAELLGEKRSGLGTKTAEILTDQDVIDWVHQALRLEFENAGFVIAPPGSRGPLLRVSTEVREVSCEEGIGFGGTLRLTLRVRGGSRILLEKAYVARDHHVVITPTSGRGVEDSLRTCLKTLLVEFLGDLQKKLEMVDPEAF